MGNIGCPGNIIPMPGAIAMPGIGANSPTDTRIQITYTEDAKRDKEKKCVEKIRKMWKMFTERYI